MALGTGQLQKKLGAPRIFNTTVGRLLLNGEERSLLGGQGAETAVC